MGYILLYWNNRWIKKESAEKHILVDKTSFGKLKEKTLLKIRKNNKHDVNSCLKRSNGCLKSFFDSIFISNSMKIRRKNLILYKLSFYN